MDDAVKLRASPPPPAAVGGMPTHAPAKLVVAPRRARPSTAATAETALHTQLRAAERAARTGRLETARWLCAAAILEHQPLLAGSRPLLREAIVALLYSRAFGQLSRLLGAVQGRTVRIRTGGATIGGQTTPDPGGMNPIEEYVLDPAWFVVEGGERTIHRWAEALAAGSPPRAVSGGGEIRVRWSMRH